MPLHNKTRVHIVPYIHDAHMLKARLGLEGIEVDFEDEFINSVHPFMSTAVGGISIMVQPECAQEAIELLKSWGEFPIEPEAPSGYYKMFKWEKLDKMTSWIPLLNKFEVGKRLLWIISILLIVAISVGGYFSSLESDKTLFEKANWCVRHIESNGKTVQFADYANDIGIKIDVDLGNSSNSSCESFLVFDKDGSLYFTNYFEYQELFLWYWDDGKILIESSESESHYLDGVYTMKMKNGHLYLTSETVRIECVNFPRY